MDIKEPNNPAKSVFKWDQEKFIQILIATLLTEIA